MERWVTWLSPVIPAGSRRGSGGRGYTRLALCSSLLRIDGWYQRADVSPLNKMKSMSRAHGDDRKIYQSPGKINIWTGDAWQERPPEGVSLHQLRTVPASSSRQRAGRLASWSQRGGMPRQTDAPDIQDKRRLEGETSLGGDREAARDLGLSLGPATVFSRWASVFPSEEGEHSPCRSHSRLQQPWEAGRNLPIEKKYFLHCWGSVGAQQVETISISIYA